MDSADVRFAAPKASPAAAGEVPRSGGGGALDRCTQASYGVDLHDFSYARILFYRMGSDG